MYLCTGKYIHIYKHLHPLLISKYIPISIYLSLFLYVYYSLYVYIESSELTLSLVLIQYHRVYSSFLFLCVLCLHQYKPGSHYILYVYLLFHPLYLILLPFLLIHITFCHFTVPMLVSFHFFLQSGNTLFDHKQNFNFNMSLQSINFNI